jgi:serine protease inhibitor
MNKTTRREMLLQAAAGIGAFQFALTGCSHNQPANAGAELPLVAQKANEEKLSLHPAVAEADNTFGVRLLQEAWKLEPNTNIFLSPLSVALALHMTLNGAKGETLKAMQKALALNGIDTATLNRANAALIAALANPDPKVQLQIANGIWANDVQPDFIKVNRDFYGAEIGTLDNALEKVNSWVKAKTQGKIETILSELPANLVAILVNAAYFKGAWTTAFEKSKTFKMPFHLPDGRAPIIPLMTRTGVYPYVAVGDDFQAIQIPYGSERVNFLVILPGESGSLEKIITTTLAKPGQLKFVPQTGTISLPRFRMEYESKLNDVLTALGMGIAFEEDKADFGGMAPDTWINRVQHKTFLEVNEEGTEAAAATAVVMETKSAAIPSRGFEMIVDRPFVCAIQDKETGVMLFLGAIVNPQT